MHDGLHSASAVPIFGRSGRVHHARIHRGARPNEHGRLRVNAGTVFAETVSLDSYGRQLWTVPIMRRHLG